MSYLLDPAARLDSQRDRDLSLNDLILGGISTLDSAASRRALDRQYSESDARLAARQFLFESFTTQAASCTLDPKVMEEALDYRDYSKRAMQLLMNVAAGKASPADVRALIEEIGSNWADMEASE